MSILFFEITGSYGTNSGAGNGVTGTLLILNNDRSSDKTVQNATRVDAPLYSSKSVFTPRAAPGVLDHPEIFVFL